MKQGLANISWRASIQILNHCGFSVGFIGRNIVLCTGHYLESFPLQSIMSLKLRGSEIGVSVHKIAEMAEDEGPRQSSDEWSLASKPCGF
jgi:hypothetical protein